MNSRYDYMEEGTERDEVLNSYYPDPLTINYNSFRMSSKPSEYVMQDSQIVFLWKFMETIYGKPEYDDMVLTLNGIPHINLLEAGNSLIVPSKADILSSFGESESELSF